MGYQVSLSHPVFPMSVSETAGLVIEPPFSRPIEVPIPRKIRMPRNVVPVNSRYQVGIASCGCTHLVVFRISAASLYDDNTSILLDTFPVKLPNALTMPETMVIGHYENLLLVYDTNFPTFAMGVLPNAQLFQVLYRIKKPLPQVVFGYGCYYVPGDFLNGIQINQQVPDVDWREYLERA